MKRICLAIILAICALSVFSKPVYYTAGDSVGTKQVEGKECIVYKVSGGETIYSVCRKYGISYASIVSANPGVNLNAVQAGQKIFVPSVNYLAENSSNPIQNTNSDLQLYTVVNGETLFSIAKKYDVKVTDLTSLNPEIKNNEIKTGQKIKIRVNETEPVTEFKTESTPNVFIEKKEIASNEIIEQPVEMIHTEPLVNDSEIQEITVKENTVVEVKATDSDNTISDINTSGITQDISSSTLPVTDKNKPFSTTFAEYAYTKNLTASSEKGVATWIEGSNDLSTQNERYYALHNDAPIGSVIKIRNLMNNRVIYAKVIGTLSESEVNQKVMVKLSAGASQKLNVLDNRFVVEATYFEVNTTSTSSK